MASKRLRNSRLFSHISGLTLLVGQSAKAAADDQLFPILFSRVNKRNVPFIGLVLVALLMSIILIVTVSPTLNKQFGLISLITVFLSLLPYLYSSAAAIILGYRAKMPKLQYGIFASIALIALIYSFWTIAGAGSKVIYGSLTLLLSVPSISSYYGADVIPC